MEKVGVEGVRVRIGRRGKLESSRTISVLGLSNERREASRGQNDLGRRDSRGEDAETKEKSSGGCFDGQRLEKVRVGHSVTECEYLRKRLTRVEHREGAGRNRK
jgi:hypothetical protein